MTARTTAHPPRRGVLPRRALVTAASLAGALAATLIAAALSGSAGATPTDGSPLGGLNTFTAVAGGVHVVGWTYDPDAPQSPVTVTARIDNQPIGTSTTASLSRPDVAAHYPSAGALHGFDWTVPVPQGTHSVCVVADNVARGTDLVVGGCRTVTLNDQPQGSFSSLTESGGKLRIRGYALDPDAPTSAISVSARVDSGTPVTVPAGLASHGFDALLPATEGRHTVCVTALNVGAGSNHSLGCRSITLSFTPSAYVGSVRATSTGVSVSGWAYDPDTSAPIATHLLVDNHTVASVTANRRGRTHSGHNFSTTLRTHSGTHRVCAVGMNVKYGIRNSTASCRSITLALKPLGAFERIGRNGGSNDLRVTGWALDPDTTGALHVAATVDGHAVPTLTANASRSDIGNRYHLGTSHGLSAVIPANDGEHTVCLTAVNVGGGHSVSLGCKIINAVHPVAPSAPQAITARAGFGGATVSWQKPASDGGAPPSAYVIRSSPGNITVTAPSSATAGVVFGLAPSTSYTFSVAAVNVAGTSAAATSSAVTTAASPPAQNTPAPISTSRYIRNVRGSSPTDLATMRAEGATDAAHNPSGHGYLILLDIGGQDQGNNGVVLSATTRFVAYSDLVRDVSAYLDGYRSRQNVSAPVIVAVGTNNDMDVNSTTGRVWATQVVNPLVAYSARYPGITVAGANDIEPGFRASYSATRSWLSGYLAGTTAPFVNNGSADGCSSTYTNRRCNNGWTMAGLHYLTGAASPIRTLGLPQVYNTTMADQWKQISLTGVVNGLTRINFAGVLTEYTACAQSRTCGSMGGVSAWTRMWNNLQSDARLRVPSLPYSTDLRIDR